MLRLCMILIACFVLESSQTDFYRNPGKDVYIATTQNLRLEWNFNPLVNTHPAVALSKTHNISTEYYCGTEPKSAITCKNTTGQVVLIKDNVTRGLSDQYDLLLVNGESLRFTFNIHVLDIKIHIHNHHNALLSMFPDYDVTKNITTKHGNQQPPSTASRLELKPLNVNIGDELKMNIIFNDKVSLITCYKVSDGLRKPGSVQSTPKREMIYRVPVLNSETDTGILVQCEVVNDTMVFVISQMVTIEYYKADNELKENTKASDVSVTKAAAVSATDANTDGNACICHWAVPVVIVLLVVVIILLVLVVCANKNKLALICKKADQNTKDEQKAKNNRGERGQKSPLLSDISEEGRPKTNTPRRERKTSDSLDGFC